MPSSTSPSKVPVLALKLVALAVGVWLGCIAYTFWLNPENAFFKVAGRTKQTWARRMTREHGPKVLVCGGSSCAFSIDGERMLEKHGLPVANMGMVAALGTKLLTRWALSEAEPGDTLIVALEPRLLTEPLTHTSAAVQFSYLLHAPQWLRNLDGSAGLPLPSQLLMLRPGGYHVFTLLAKACAGAPLYRYQARDVHASGWLQTPLRLSFDSPPLHGPHLSAEAVQLLRRLSEYGAARHIRLAYSLPWRFTPPDQVEMFQQQNITFLLQVAAFFPVLKDPKLGAHSVREHFADTAWHLTGEGSAARSDALARQIQRWEVWSPAELRSRPASPEPRPPQR